MWEGTASVCVLALLGGPSTRLAPDLLNVNEKGNRQQLKNKLED